MHELPRYLSFIQHYFLILWETIYFKSLIVYALYLIVLFYLIFPLCKKFLVPLVNKTKTNLDNEIYGKIRTLLKIFVWLFGLNLIYNLYFLQTSKLLDMVYNLILTIEFVLLYLMFHRAFNILLKYFIKKFSHFINKNIANLIKLTVDIILFSIFALLILKAWGVNITPLLASAGIFGFAVAMASKSIIENFLSGLLLFADKSINVGDTIILSDGTTAVVEEINIRTTKLRTFDGNVVIIPNSELLNEKIVNKSLSDVSPQKRVTVTVGISYGDDTQIAKDLLSKYLSELEGVDLDSITVYVDSLADWSVNIKWKAMVDADKRSYLLEKQILERVYKEFPQNGLNFPFPTYTIELNSKNMKDEDALN